MRRGFPSVGRSQSRLSAGSRRKGYRAKVVSFSPCVTMNLSDISIIGNSGDGGSRCFGIFFAVDAPESALYAKSSSQSPVPPFPGFVNSD